MEETAGPWHNGVDGERHRDLEAREPDVVDGLSTAAETNSHRRGSADKYKFSSYGYQVRGGDTNASGVSRPAGRLRLMILSLSPEEDQGEGCEWLFHTEQGNFCQTQSGPETGPVQSGGVGENRCIRGINASRLLGPLTCSEELMGSGITQFCLHSPPTFLFFPLQERSQLDLLKQELETYAVPVNLKWSWKEESLGTTLENNWTQIVDSHLVRASLQKRSITLASVQITQIWATQCPLFKIYISR